MPSPVLPYCIKLYQTYAIQPLPCLSLIKYASANAVLDGPFAKCSYQSAKSVVLSSSIQEECTLGSVPGGLNQRRPVHDIYFSNNTHHSNLFQYLQYTPRHIFQRFGNKQRATRASYVHNLLVENTARTIRL